MFYTRIEGKKDTQVFWQIQSVRIWIIQFQISLRLTGFRLGLYT